MIVNFKCYNSLKKIHCQGLGLSFSLGERNGPTLFVSLYS